MAAVVPIDLVLGGMPGAAAAYLVTGPAPAVVDPGPPSSLPRLRRALEGLGVPPAELRHVLVTHGHREHAGAAGALVREAPGLLVHAHEKAVERLASPEPLPPEGGGVAEGAEDGEWVPVPEDSLRPWRPGDAAPLEGVGVVEAPGHSEDHVAFHLEPEGILFVGDALGVVLTPESPTHPSAQPPEVDPGAWRRTLRELSELEASWVALAHFGIHDDPSGRVEAMKEALERLEARVARALSQGGEDHDRGRFREQSLKAQAEHLPEVRVRRFFERFDPAHDWDGIRAALSRDEGEEP